MILGPAHVAELQASTIDPAVAAERGYLTVTEDMRDVLVRSRVPGYATEPATSYPGLLIPMYSPGGGDALSFQFKPAEPVPHPSTGKPLKYVSRRGTPNMLDVHPRNAAAVRDVSVPLWITEGVKKADALTSRGRCVIALTGVYNFRSKTGTLGDWEDVVLKGRTVVICYDSDARSNDSVLTAMRRIGTWLKSRGAAAVWYLVVPPLCHGQPVKGVDDWFAAGGTIEDLESTATDYVPNSGTVQDPTFTDAYLAATVADDALGDQFLFSPGLGGWLVWDGRRWARCGTETVIESIREYAVRRYQDAVTEFAKDPNQNRVKRALDGWRTVLTKAKLTALEFLCRGICLTDAEEFDSHNDLLNVANGVVDLTTGELLPHDPELHLTRLAPTKYVPGAEHVDWKSSLESLPPETHDWWRLRMGQAATGYMTPDDKLVLVTGGGENGKSSMLDAIGRSLGDYYVQVSHRALLASNDAHPTELMDFKGSRLAVVEETPEERRLNVTRLKQTVGTPRIKARLMRSDSATFDATHSLFLSTNFPPTVDETDHGTWRRLVRIHFPYTWLMPGEPAKPDWIVRPADPGLRQRMKEGRDGQHEAILAWLVAGAREWYQRDRVMPAPPAPVQAATAEWRGRSDTLGEYVADRLEYDPNGWITSVDLLADLNYWLKDHGHQPWSDKLLSARMPDVHSLSMRKVAVRSNLPGRSTRVGGGGALSGVNVKAWVGVRFRS